MLSDLKARLTGQRPGGALTDPAYGFLLEPPPDGERVALQVQATSGDAATAELRAVAAVRLRGPRILASERLVVAFPGDDALGRVLRFVGSRPLAGHHLDFSLAVLDRAVEAAIGIPLPNPRIEVSGLYYDRKRRTATKAAVDLRLDAIARDLGLPPPARPAADDPWAAALAAAMVLLRLEGGE